MARCKKYQNWGNHAWNQKQWCREEVFKGDEHGRVWEHCKKDACRICLDEVKMSKGKQEITDGFWICHKEQCRNINKANKEAVSLIIAETKSLNRQIASLGIGNTSSWELLTNDLKTIEVEAALCNIKPEPVIIPSFLTLVKNTIDAWQHEMLILTREEREALKSAYDNGGGNLANTVREKTTTFFLIAKKRTLNTERNNFLENKLKVLDGYNLLSEEEKGNFINQINNSQPNQFDGVLNQAQKAINKKKEGEERLQIIQTLKTELNNSPAVSITELDNKYHNYENLTSGELKKIKDEIIEAIKNKRVEKKLTDLLNQAENCSDNDLWTFIQLLENYVSAPASSSQKNAYNNCQNEVDTTLNKLRERWNNLSEDAKMENYWNNADKKFDNWLEESENFLLADNDPYKNFKKDVRECKSKETIEIKEAECRNHILTKFKEKVKQELGAERQNGEYAEIDNANDFEAVKLAKNNIKQKRGNYNPSAPDKNRKNSREPSNNLAPKIIIGVVVAGLILALISVIAKKKKNRTRVKDRKK